MTGISPVRLGAALAAPQACRLGGLGQVSGNPGPLQLLAESAWSAVPALPMARFSRPLAEPAVPVSRQRALRGICRQGWLTGAQGLGILLPR